MAALSALIFFLYTPAALWRFSTKNFLRLIKARVSLSSNLHGNSGYELEADAGHARAGSSCYMQYF
jgi:hypothetical protein